MRYELHLTEEEMDILAWLLKSEIQVQDMIPDRDEKLFKQLTELYETVVW